MKKRARVQQSVSFYSNEPAVSRNLIADQSMTQNAGLGFKTPRSVDKAPGRVTGVGGFTSKGHPKAAKPKVSIPKLGSKSGPPQQGKLRMSGHSGAHRVGMKLKGL